MNGIVESIKEIVRVYEYENRSTFDETLVYTCKEGILDLEFKDLISKLPYAFGDSRTGEQGELELSRFVEYLRGVIDNEV